jgi:glyoxylate reductase
MARRVYTDPQVVKSGRWGDFDPLKYLGADVHHKTLGIVGMGRIGSEVARRARGFDMEILYHNRKRAEVENGAEYVDSLNELLERSDFVTLHNPLTLETTGLMSVKQFGKMKSTAYLINTTRGPVVDQDALYEALTTGEIAGAALDVTVPEPMPPSHPLLGLDNCLIMPHTASATTDTRMKMAMMCVDNALAGMAGEWPPYCVNRDDIEGRSRLEGKV